MKILVINSSPSMDKGNTAIILKPFLDGMREAGAEVELFYTKKLDINPCQGELNCLLKTPGQCWQKDDMNMLLPKLRTADVWVLATPVYVDGVSGPMKNMLDRILPLIQPFFEARNGHCRHPIRQEIEEGKIVLVSSCGLWEIDNFDPLLIHMKAICKNLVREFTGALLRPHAPALKSMMERGAPVQDILEAAKEAGHQIGQGKRISAETLSIISRELLPLEIYMQIANQNFQQTLDALEKK